MARWQATCGSKLSLKLGVGRHRVMRKLSVRNIPVCFFMFCVIKRPLSFNRRAQFYRLRFAGKHIFYIFLIIRFPLLRVRKCMKMQRNWLEDTQDLLMRCQEHLKIAYWFLYCICRTNCIGNPYNVMIVTFLEWPSKWCSWLNGI